MNESRQLDLTREPLPRGFWLGLIPLLAMTAITLYLATQWDRIPERFPRHWDLDGHANGWSTKSFLGVFARSILFITVGAWIWAFGLAIWYGSRRTSPWRGPLLNTMALAVWPMLVIQPMIALLPLTGQPNKAIFIPAIGLFFALVVACPVYALRHFGSIRRSTPDFAWFKFDWYANRNDSAVFVDKRGGLFPNFANPLSWLFFIWPLLLPLLIRLLVPTSAPPPLP